MSHGIVSPLVRPEEYEHGPGTDAEQPVAGHARHDHPQNAGARADARLWHRRPHRADQQGRLSGQRRLPLSGAPPAGARRADPSGVGGDREQSPREVLQPDRAWARPARTGHPRLGSAVGRDRAHSSRLDGRAVMMARLRRTAGRLRGLFYRKHEEQLLDDELRAYLEAAIGQHMARGLSRAEAVRAARVALGSLDAVKEAVRDVGWETLADAAAQDVRRAVRCLRSRPMTSLAAIGMLGLGIGITTAMFTIIDALLLRPVPFRDADRLAQVVMNDEHGGAGDVARPVLRAWKGTPVFEAVEGHHSTTSLIESGDRLVERPTAFVTRGLFDKLGVHPIRGRGFEEGEGRAGTSDRVVMSEDLWRSAFGADPAIIGSHITVNREPLTVVGILPSDFRFPTATTELWRPIDYEAPPPDAMPRPVPLVRIPAAIPTPDPPTLPTTAPPPA